VRVRKCFRRGNCWFVLVLLCWLRWVIWVFFYIKSKAFEIRSEARFKGIRFAEWSRGPFRAVMLGKPSVVVEVDGGGFD
jgi:hypothetical protein